MQFLIGNQLGWIGLMGVPVVMLLFMLQQKAKIERTSTLFLLEHLVPESRGGRKLQRLVQSVPLWSMLFSVILLTWLLLDPRRVDQRSRQSVAVVMDSSFSMQAFQDKLEEAMKGPMERLSSTAGETQWILMESDLGKPLIYRGERFAELWKALRSWKAEAGAHDLEPAIRTARALAGGQGLVLVVSDRPPTISEGTGWLAVGRPLDNAGFAGGVARRPEGEANPSWEAVVRNYSDRPTQLSWRLAGKDFAGEYRPLELPAGEGILLKGFFPEGKREIYVELQGDIFGLDDRLPLVVPGEKALHISVVSASETGPETAAFLRAIKRSVPGFEQAREGSRPDLTILTSQIQNPAGYGKNAVVLYAGPAAKRSASLPVLARHELVRDLSWNGLLADPLERAGTVEGDEILLWKESKPLIVLRTVETAEGAARQLHFLFDFEKSNAGRLPSTAVLIYRFCSLIRNQAVGFSSGNVVLGQELDIAGVPGIPLRVADESAPGGKILRAPRRPSVFEVVQGERLLFQGAAQFADVAEADFREAGAGDGTGALVLRQVRANSEKDLWAPVWILLLGGTLLLAWWWETPAFGNPPAGVQEDGS